MSLSAYATSSFSKHSLISTVLVVQNVVNGMCFGIFSYDILTNYS